MYSAAFFLQRGVCLRQTQTLKRVRVGEAQQTNNPPPQKKQNKKNNNNKTRTTNNRNQHEGTNKENFKERMERKTDGQTDTQEGRKEGRMFLSIKMPKSTQSEHRARLTIMITIYHSSENTFPLYQQLADHLFTTVIFHTKPPAKATATQPMADFCSH